MQRGLRDKNQKGNHVIGYIAKVRITVWNEELECEIIREGTGLGSGINRDLFSAIEGAAKEAETDAMKRALMTFRNKFGLALYDKYQVEVKEGVIEEDMNEDPILVERMERFFEEAKAQITESSNLDKWMEDNLESLKELGAYSKEMRDEVVSLIKERRKAEQKNKEEKDGVSTESSTDGES